MRSLALFRRRQEKIADIRPHRILDKPLRKSSEPNVAVLLVPQKGEESSNLAIHISVDHLLGGVKVVMGKRAVDGCWSGG